MLLQASRSLLLIIDIQKRLAPSIHNAAEVINTTCWLLDIARELKIPVLTTEQYPKGLGSTVSPIQERLQPAEIIEKSHFSAWRESLVQQRITELNRPQILLVGTEAHVCCLQTAMELLEQGYEVYLVETGLGSRQEKDKHLALERLKQFGAQVVSREMVAFEWLEQAGTEIFRKISKGWIK